MTNEEIIKELSGKTVLEINELVKALEEAWQGVRKTVDLPARGLLPTEVR